MRQIGVFGTLPKGSVNPAAPKVFRPVDLTLGWVKFLAGRELKGTVRKGDPINSTVKPSATKVFSNKLSIGGVIGCGKAVNLVPLGGNNRVEFTDVGVDTH